METNEKANIENLKNETVELNEEQLSKTVGGSSDGSSGIICPKCGGNNLLTSQIGTKMCPDCGYYSG